MPLLFFISNVFFVSGVECSACLANVF
jgi:hypothetical protein